MVFEAQYASNIAGLIWPTSNPLPSKSQIDHSSLSPSNQSSEAATQNGSWQKDIRHTPPWDLKIPREFEAKNPGPPKKRHRGKKVCIVISDDEPDEQLDKLGDDWTQDLLDDRITNNPEHWDIHDALRLGKR